MMQNSIRLSLFVAAGAVFLTCASPNRGGTGMGGSTGTGGGGNYTSGTGNVAPPLAGTGNVAGALVGTGNVGGGLGGNGNEGGGGSGAGAGGDTGGSAGGRGGAAGGATGGASGSGGAGATTEPPRTFPTQACLDKASALLAMMTADEKIAQLHQVERANVSASDITSYGVGSVYSQGSSAPAHQHPDRAGPT